MTGALTVALPLACAVAAWLLLLRYARPGDPVCRPRPDYWDAMVRAAAAVDALRDAFAVTGETIREAGEAVAEFGRLLAMTERDE